MIGLFIGSFNPPTLAHLNICLKLKNIFDEIVFIPVNTNEKRLVSMYHRVNMLKIYTNKFAFLKIDDIMKDYSYFDYRILDKLREKYHDIKIIIGSDILNNLNRFSNKDYLLQNYQFVVVTRDNNVNKILNDKYKDYKKYFEVYEFFSDISSTKARNLIKNNALTKDILDQDINDYIIKNHLYF